MRLEEINRQVNEATEGQGTKDQENRPLTSEVRERLGNTSGSKSKEVHLKERSDQ